MSSTLARLDRFARPAPADGALLERFLTGDQSAFALLVGRHAALVLGTCRRVLRHQQDAEDAFQATFLVLARRAADVWPRDAVGAWLFGVARRIALKARTARARRAARWEPLTDVPAPEPVPAEPDTAEVVQRAVAALPEVYRSAVVACDLQGLSRKEAAARLGWSEGALAGRLVRARTLLAARLTRQGLALPAGGVAAVLAVTGAAPAALCRSTAALANAGPVPASIAILTEGAVRSMGFVKIKAVVAAVAVACVFAFGAVVATGAADSTRPRAPSEQLRPQNATVQVPAATKSIELPTGRRSDLDPLQGAWSVLKITEDGKSQRRDGSKEWADWIITVDGATLRMPYQVASEMRPRYREYQISVDGARRPKTIDMIDRSNPVARGLYEFIAPATTCAECHAAGDRFKVAGSDFLPLCEPAVEKVAGGRAAGVRLRLAVSIDDKRPAQFDGPGVVVFEVARSLFNGLGLTRNDLPAEFQNRSAAERAALTQRLVELTERDLWHRAARDPRGAETFLDEMRKVVSRAEHDAHTAAANLERARAALSAAEKTVERLKRLEPVPVKGGPAFTVHVRPVAVPEQVIRMASGGRDTVLEALVHAADHVSLKSDAVSVWLVRGKDVLAVDLFAITKGGDAKTNYVLKPGDRLFVQAKPAR